MSTGNTNIQPHRSGIKTVLTAAIEKRQTWP